MRSAGEWRALLCEEANTVHSELSEIDIGDDELIRVRQERKRLLPKKRTVCMIELKQINHQSLAAI
jgi:hypothetical protein